MRHTIAVCTTGRRPGLGPTMRAVRDAVAPENVRDTEVLTVLSGGAADEHRVAQLLADAFHGSGLLVRLVVQRMPGIARARNLALACTHGAVLSFLDDDVRPCGPDWQRAILNTFAARSDVGLLGGPLRCVAPPGANPNPGWRSPYTENLLSCFWKATSGPCNPEAVWTANASYRVAATAGTRFPEDLGWQSDSDLRLAGEDTWFNQRLAARGWTAWYEALAAANHHVDVERFTLLWLLRRAVIHGRTYLVFRCAEGIDPFSTKLGAYGGLVRAILAAVKQATLLRRERAFTRCVEAAAHLGTLTMPGRELRRVVEGLRRDAPTLDVIPECATHREGVV